jgi:hypothetical protein
MYVLDWLIARLPYEGLLLMSLAYLTFDFYPQVSSLAAIWRNPAFWILWLVFSFLDLLAFGILYANSFAHLVVLIPSPILATAAIQFLATIGVYSVLQSFTLQFAGRKVVDVEELIARFRTAALQSSVAKRASLSRRHARKLAEGLRAIYHSDLQAFSEDYSQIMALAKMPRDRIVLNLDSYKNSQGSERDALLNELVMRMAVADPDNVRELLSKRRSTVQSAP